MDSKVGRELTIDSSSALRQRECKQTAWALFHLCVGKTPDQQVEIMAGSLFREFNDGLRAAKGLTAPGSED